MNRRWLGIGFVVLCLALVSGLSVVAESSVLIEADQLIVTKRVPQIQESIGLLEKQLEKQGEDADTLWLLAKAYLYLGDRSAKDSKLAIFETGKEYADRAVVQDDSSAHAHYWQAALIGRVGQTRGVMQSLFMVKPLKAALDRVLELDPDYGDAYFALSQLYQEAPGFPLSIGNKVLALENAYKAVELDGDNLDYQIQLAKALQHNNRSTEAKKVLEAVLARRDIGRDPELKAESEELLKIWK